LILPAEFSFREKKQKLTKTWICSEKMPSTVMSWHIHNFSAQRHSSLSLSHTSKHEFCWAKQSQ